MGKKLLLVIATVVIVSGYATIVSAAEQRAVAGPGAFTAGYLTPTITITKGDFLVFTNLDVFEHDLVHDVEADGFGGKRNVPWCKVEASDEHDHAAACPVFWSELVGAGGNSQVLGLNRVKPGKTYSFFCTKHHNMTGKLTVNG